MFMDILATHQKTPALARFSLYCWNVISLLISQPIMGRFYKMRVSWEFNIYNLFRILLLTRCYRFRDVNIICG